MTDEHLHVCSVFIFVPPTLYTITGQAEDIEIILFTYWICSLIHNFCKYIKDLPYLHVKYSLCKLTLHLKCIKTWIGYSTVVINEYVVYVKIRILISFSHLVMF